MRPQRGWLDLRWGEPLGYAGRKDEARAQYQIASKLYVKSKLESTPLTEIPGLPAPLAVSSPEATALDLIAFSHRLGGLARPRGGIKGGQDAPPRGGDAECHSRGRPGDRATADRICLRDAQVRFARGHRAERASEALSTGAAGRARPARERP